MGFRFLTVFNIFVSTNTCSACEVVCYNVLTASLFLIQNIPTLGTVAITMALHNCDEVAVAGFGYNLNMPNAPLHYYEGVKMSAIKEVSTLFLIYTFHKFVKVKSGETLSV